MEALTAVPSEKTVQEYTDILKRVDWETGLKAAAILVIGLTAVKLILRATRKILGKSHVPPTVHSMMITLLRILMDLVVVLAAMNAIGIPITSFVALLSLAGLAVTLGLQGVLGNLASGVIVLGSHPFEVGHLIEHDGIMGTVREIRMLHTIVETLDGRVVYFPNSSVAGGRVTNITGTGRRRVEVKVSASYNQTPEQVRKAIRDAIEQIDSVLAEPEPVVYVEGYGDSAINYCVWVWTKSEEFLPVQFRLTELLYTTFAQNSVEMTYPHLRVHMQ